MATTTGTKGSDVYTYDGVGDPRVSLSVLLVRNQSEEIIEDGLKKILYCSNVLIPGYEKLVEDGRRLESEYYLSNEEVENIFDIIDILMKGVMKRLVNLGFSMELSAEAKQFIADKGYDSQFGARPLHRAIQKYLEDPLAEEILNMTIKSGDILVANLDESKEKINFTFKGAGKETKEGSEV